MADKYTGDIRIAWEMEGCVPHFRIGGDDEKGVGVLVPLSDGLVFKSSEEMELGRTGGQIPWDVFDEIMRMPNQRSGYMRRLSGA